MAVFTGGAGADSFYGTTGADTLSGLGGADSLVGGGGANLVKGGEGNDALTTTWGVDTIDGGAGIDSWTGLRGPATANLTFTYDGAAGSGSLTGGTTLSNIEIVNLTTGSGNDDITIKNPLNSLLLRSSVDGGAGTDKLTIDNSGSAVDSRMDVFVDGGTLDGDFSTQYGVNGLAFQNLERLNIKFGSGSDRAFIHDSPFTAGAQLTLDGGAGDDLLSLHLGPLPGTIFDVSGGAPVTNVPGLSFTNFERYSISVGGGGDYVALSGGDDLLTSGPGPGADTLDGGGGSDKITSYMNDNLLKGGAGDDIIDSISSSPTPGADTVDGGAGDDTWNFEYFSSADMTFVYDAASGTGSLTGGTTLTSIEHASVFTGSGDDDVTINNAPYNLAGGYYSGGEGFDTLTVNGIDVSPDTLTTIDSGDRGGLAGTFDDGSYYWFNGYEAVKLALSSTDETIRVNALALTSGNSLTIDGGAGDNTLAVYLGIGSPGGMTFKVVGDTLTSNVPGLTALNFKTYSLDLAGADSSQVIGGAGDDTVVGGDGDDTIEGGAGNDVLDGAGGADMLSYYHATAGVTVNLTLAAAQNTGGAGIDTLSDFQDLHGSQYGDTLRAGAGAHTVEAFGGSDLIYIDTGSSGLYDGGASVDILSFANSTLGVTASLAVTTSQATGIGSMTLLNFELVTGSAYADSLTGSSAINTLTGGGGADTLAGGAAADAFRYLQAGDSTIAAADLITDFHQGTDKISLTAVRTGASDSYAISTVGPNTQLDVDLHGDGSIDMRILLVGQSVLTSSDLIW
ncbi:M10 family metallopeptidase C-terminal domain-containing protein [Phenylobacterium sp. LjRoot225]|uniref:beta strand repeat-containing protein n=1 Tax=Phenylobacterium sp. LjRoot225 TaxID=3342285 RepID=UPI003ECE4C98